MSVLKVVLVFVLVSIDPPKVFFIVFLLYSLSGPVQLLVRRVRKKKLLEDSETQENSSDQG